MADNKISIVVVVNTEDVSVSANVNQPLHVVAEHALKDSESKDRPLTDFDLKDSSGTKLDLAMKVGDAGVQDGAKLYLALRAGVTG
jgi:hypothetical protein